MLSASRKTKRLGEIRLVILPTRQLPSFKVTRRYCLFKKASCNLAKLTARLCRGG